MIVAKVIIKVVLVVPCKSNIAPTENCQVNNCNFFFL